MFEPWMQLIQGKLERWGVYAIRMLPNLVVAIIILAIFVLIARLVKRFSEKILGRLSHRESLSGLASAILYTIVIGVGIMVSLEVLNLDKAVSSLLAGVGILGLALGFAFQDLTANFISGTFIAIKRPFDVGHIIETNGFVGRIEDIQLRATKMNTIAGLHVIIPNKDIFQKPIINYSLTGRRRIEMEFFVPGKTDLEALQGSLQKNLSSIEPAGDPEVLFSQIDEGGKTKLYISFWTTDSEPDQFMRARHAAVMAVSADLKSAQVFA